MKKARHPVSYPLATSQAFLASALAACAGADQPAAAPAVGLFEKPAWLTDLSLGVTESYDDNIYGVSGHGPNAPQSSWVTVVSPKVGFNLGPLLGEQSVVQALGFAYAPEVATYHDASVESYTAHRFANSIKGQADSISFNLENALNYVDGSEQGPIYSGTDKYRSGFASIMAKERRQQIQDRAKAVFQYDWGQFFVRPTASLIAFDMMTDFRSTAGYQNYPSRYDANGGSDVGYRLTDSIALTAGYRYGHQYQQALPKAIDPYRFASSSDYHRALLGVEGKPWNWLTFSAQGGPDFRSYAESADVSGRHPTTYYGEAAVTAGITSKDSVALKYKQWQTVAYTGKLPYFDSNYELSYRRKLMHGLSAELAGRIASYDFTPGSDPGKSNQRNDYLYAVSPGLTYAFTPNLSANLAYTLQLGRNVEDNPPGGAQYREFNRNLVSCGLALGF